MVEACGSEEKDGDEGLNEAEEAFNAVCERIELVLRMYL